MLSNDIIEAAKERRTIFKFKDEDVSEESINTILETGRWAPSFANIQPWTFIVVRDEELKHELYEVARRITLFREGIEEAPVVIAVTVDQEAPVVIAVAVNQEEDPNHYIEAGAVATQNMALAAHSIGLASYWIGVFDVDKDKSSAEKDAKEILDIPEDYRLISLLPIGKKGHERTSERKDLDEIVIRK